jgi:hypothetical protein
MENQAAMTTKEEANIDWSLTTWKGSRLQQHREFYALSFRRKLEIVEELADFARATIERRRRQGLPYIDPSTRERVPGTAVIREEPPGPPPQS